MLPCDRVFRLPREIPLNPEPIETMPTGCDDGIAHELKTNLANERSRNGAASALPLAMIKQMAHLTQQRLPIPVTDAGVVNFRNTIL